MHSALRESGTEARLLAGVLEAVEDAVYVLDEAGSLVCWNDRFEARTGYADEELAALDPSELVAGEPDGDAAAALDPPAEGIARVDLVTGDGERVPHEVRGTAVEVPGSGRRFTCVVARDVSERLARERELERYRRIVDSVGDGVSALDEDLTFGFVNERLCELFGCSREERRGRDPRDFIAESDERWLADGPRRRVVEGDREASELRVTAKLQNGDRRELATNYRILGEADGESCPASAGVIRDVTERVEHEAQLAAQRELLQAILNAIPDVVFAFDTDFQPLETEFLREEFAGYTNEELAEIDPLELVPPERRDELAALMVEVLETGETVTVEIELLTKDGERIPYELRATRLGDGDDVRGIVGSGRDITERVEYERSLEQRTEELETLNRITELLLNVIRRLAEHSSRRAIERAVCDRLAESALYRFAWIGEREVDGDCLIQRVNAGAEGDGAARFGADASNPAARVLETGEVQALTVDDAGFEAWRDAVAAPDVRSVIAVPLVHADTVYGVLTVHATREDAFSEREQSLFGVLGETVGFVINAVKRRKLLFADAVTELEFGLGESEAIFAQLSRALACTVTLDGYIDADDQWLVYLEVDGASAVDAVYELSNVDRTRDVRAVADWADGCRLEATLEDAPLLDAAAAVGATVTDATSEGDAGHAVMDVPVEVDVRETVELLTGRLPAAELRARRERDRRPTRLGTPDGLLEELTDRQREAIGVAFRAGYFDWPRESTAEEVAATLGVSPPTLHAHLRKAQRRLLAGLLETD